MKKPSLPTVSPATSGVLRRTLLGGAVLLALTALAGLLAFLTRDDAPAEKPKPEASSPHEGSPPAAPSASPSLTDPGPDRVEAGSRPETGDPVDFGKAAARALWSYDTRSTSHKEHLAELRTWMTGESRYADWASVKRQLPDAVLWERMSENKQRATAEAAEGRFPQAFKDAMANEPGAITEAYVYVVTVHGRQSLTWTGSGAGAEARSVTLAVQCRPEQPCGLVGVLPQVLP
ncbi:hypothetical protein [Streptomyces sp. ST2-7A]|uniref:hypothetical protein n=1 Tax=Streptomyces sp. ST2-7A TaxID=2907214 RepID=UPI001F1FDFD5|nr:hypothetical protein [Streptomyces sp. ST2-7A]MCE7080167.1 hypothetical protein [Streptomyces sp. ST2-7A]